MEGENQFLSKSEFAAMKGWSPSYVTKLKEQQRLVLCPDGKRVDVQATLALLERTSDPGKESVRQHHSSERTERHVGSQVKPDAKTGESPASTGADPKYWEAKARRENSLAELADLELRRKQGDLVERQRVEDMAFAAGRMLRDAVLGLPTKLSPELAAMTDPFQIEIKLRDALRQVFDDMAKITAEDLDKAMEPSH